MADFGYTPEIGQVQTFTPQIRTKSKLAGLAGDLGNLLTAKVASDQRVAKEEKKYLDDEAKERLNEASLQLMDSQDELYENYNTTADPVKRNEFVQKFEEDAQGIGRWYGLEGDDLTSYSKSHASTTNKLRLYNSNVLGKVNDKVNTAKASTADFSTIDVTNTTDMDTSVIDNNKQYLITTQFGGDTAKYYNAKFSDFGVKAKEAISGSTSPEEIETMIQNLDIFATKIGDKVSVNNKDATTDSTMYNEYHKLRQYLQEHKSSEITKLKTSLGTHRKGNNKKSFMETVERIDKNGGYANPDLKQSTIDSWTTGQSKANTAKINAMKKSPDYVNGYADPKVVSSTYSAHGGTDLNFAKDYQAKFDFTQNYLANPMNADLSADPKQAKIVSEDLVKKLILSGDIATAVDYASKTGVGGVLSSYATATVSETDPSVLSQNVAKLMEGYNRNTSVMGKNMTTDSKSAMLFYSFQMRNGKPLDETHVARVVKGNEEGITPKGGKDFNDKFAGKHDYSENLAMYSALVKYGTPPETAIEMIEKDVDSHKTSVSTGLFSSMEIDLKHSPKGVSEYSPDELEEVLTPLVEKVDKLDIDGEKKLVFDPSVNGFRLYIDEIALDSTTMNIDDMIKINKQEKELEAKGAWATTSRKVSAMWDGLMSSAGETIREGIDNFRKAKNEFDREDAINYTMRLSTNKALRAEEAHKDPKYIEGVFKVALDTRENASALFNKDGINDYIGFLNSGFSQILAEPLTVSTQGKVIVDNTPIAVTSPEGRKELQKVIEQKQEIFNIRKDGTKDYGTRVDGSNKGSGWLGEIPMTDGSNRVMTEFSVGVNIGGKEVEIPSIVPTLTKEELSHLSSGEDVTTPILDKAVAHAKEQISKGKSPFKEQITTTKAKIIDNLDNNMEAIRVAEVGTQKYVEGELHVGQETITKANPRGKKNTTRYGVVIDSFPKQKGESDLAHANRYYMKKVYPAIANVKGIETASQEVITGLSKLVWNKGNIIKNLDLNNPKKTISTLLDVTTTGGRHSNGVINRTIADYSILAKELGYPEVTKVVTTKAENGKYRIKYYDSNDKIIHDDKRKATTAGGSSIKAGTTYQVRDNNISISSGVLTQ